MRLKRFRYFALVFPILLACSPPVSFAQTNVNPIINPNWIVQPTVTPTTTTTTTTPTPPVAPVAPTPPPPQPSAASTAAMNSSVIIPGVPATGQVSPQTQQCLLANTTPAQAQSILNNINNHNAVAKSTLAQIALANNQAQIGSMLTNIGRSNEIARKFLNKKTGANSGDEPAPEQAAAGWSVSFDPSYAPGWSQSTMPQSHSDSFTNGVSGLLTVVAPVGVSFGSSFGYTNSQMYVHNQSSLHESSDSFSIGPFLGYTTPIGLQFNLGGSLTFQNFSDTTLATQDGSTYYNQTSSGSTFSYGLTPSVSYTYSIGDFSITPSLAAAFSWNQRYTASPTSYSWTHQLVPTLSLGYTIGKLSLGLSGSVPYTYERSSDQNLDANGGEISRWSCSYTGNASYAFTDKFNVSVSAGQSFGDRNQGFNGSAGLHLSF